MRASETSARRRIGDFIRQFNKFLVNKLTLWLARHGIGPFSIIQHIGRKSGHAYHTPVLATYVEQFIIIPLSYGDHVDWLQNILAQQGCQIFHNNQQFTAIHPEIIPGDTALSHLPEYRRRTFARFRIESFLRLERIAGANQHTSSGHDNMSRRR